MSELDPTQQHIGPAPPEQAREASCCPEGGHAFGASAVAHMIEALDGVKSMAHQSARKRGAAIKRKFQEVTEDLKDRVSPDNAPDEIVYKKTGRATLIITERKLSVPTQGLEEEFRLLKKLAPPPAAGPKAGPVVNPGR